MRLNPVSNPGSGIIHDVLSQDSGHRGFMLRDGNTRDTLDSDVLQKIAKHRGGENSVAVF